MMQGQRILQCLEHSLDSNSQHIKLAEQQLAVEAQQHGFGVCLCQILLERSIPADTRQIAAVLLKQYVKHHWVEGERGFQPPETSEQDKQQIRTALPAGLSDPNSKVRTAVAMAVAGIANWDAPNAWPGLLEFIVNSIKEKNDSNLLMGCLRCLDVMASDLDGEQTPHLVQALSPELAALVANPSTPNMLSATCLSIMGELAQGLATLSGTYQQQVRNMLVPLMQPWLSLICNVLSSDIQVRTSWPAKAAALRLALPLVTYFSKPLEGSMLALMGAAWQLLLAAQPLHQSVLVEGHEEDEPSGEQDDNPTTLEGLLAQLFELLLSFVGPPRFCQQLQAALPQTLYIAIAYLQMTEDQSEAWIASANTFVADEEEDMVSCRASSELLLCELADTFGSPALQALLEAVGRRLMEADAAAVAQPATQRHGAHWSWWRMREAALVAVGACCEQLVHAASTQSIPAQQLHQLLDSLLQRDLQPLLQQQQQHMSSVEQQFLAARALGLGAKLHKLMTVQQKEAFLVAASAAVTLPTAPPVKVSAFKALKALCSTVQPQTVQPLLQPLLGALLQLLKGAEEECLHLILEVLAELITAADERAGMLNPEHAMAVAEPVLQVWISHTSDPLIAPDAQAVISAIAAQPLCLPSLVAAAALTLAGILGRGAATRLAKKHGRQEAAGSARRAKGNADEAPMLVEASLDLLATLVSPRQPAVALELSRGILPPTLTLVQACDDASELNSAVTLLLKILRSCPAADLLSVSVGGSSSSDGATASDGNASGNNSFLTSTLCATRHLLSPSQPDSCSGVAGPLLVQLLKTFPEHMTAEAPAAVSHCRQAMVQYDPSAAVSSRTYLGLLLGDAVAKLASGGCSPTTVTSLLEFIVRLALLDVQQLVQLLDAIRVQQPGGAVVAGLAVVMPLWLEHTPDMTGTLLTRQCAAALLQLLQLRHHPGLAGLLVQGQPLDAAAATWGGRVTRSKARQQGGLQYSQVFCPIKVLQVLGQLLVADAEASSNQTAGPNLQHLEEGEWDEGYETDEDEGIQADEHDSPTADMMLKGMAYKGVPLNIPSDELDLLDALIRSAATTPVPEDPSEANDPLLRVNFRSMLRQELGVLVSSDPGFLAAAAAQLGPCREVQALQELLQPAVSS